MKESEEEVVEKVKQIVDLAKPKTDEKTAGCPNCTNKVLIRIQNRRRCNACGWEDPITTLPNPAQSRAELMEK